MFAVKFAVAVDLNVRLAERSEPRLDASARQRGERREGDVVLDDLRARLDADRLELLDDLRL